MERKRHGMPPARSIVDEVLTITNLKFHHRIRIAFVRTQNMEMTQMFIGVRWSFARANESRVVIAERFSQPEGKPKGLVCHSCSELHGSTGPDPKDSSRQSFVRRPTSQSGEALPADEVGFPRWEQDEKLFRQVQDASLRHPGAYRDAESSISSDWNSSRRRTRVDRLPLPRGD